MSDNTYTDRIRQILIDCMGYRISTMPPAEKEFLEEQLASILSLNREFIGEDQNTEIDAYRGYKEEQLARNKLRASLRKEMGGGE